EIMILGTYHFDNPGRDLHNLKADDVLTPQRQHELDALAAALSEFRPTRIMVERVATGPDLADPHYARFTPAELGKNRDERVQLGYRLAHRLGHKAVYAIDEQPDSGEPDYFPFDRLMDWAKANGQEERLQAFLAQGAAALSQGEKGQILRTIPELLGDANQPEGVARDHKAYYGLLSFGDLEQQVGADLNAMWYLRNAKIFCKLQKAAKPGDRVLVIYGSGHNYWLRHFAATTSGYNLVEPGPYLKKAADGLR
ncbi:MAG: hypothetical protein JW793_02080, partial [Acidobacteria bacterium]|nr:hypothetical protein [Acidobacteriota bacterium]